MKGVVGTAGREENWLWEGRGKSWAVDYGESWRGVRGGAKS